MALLLCFGLLAPLSGCERPFGGVRHDAGAEQAGEEVARKPGTYVAFGDFRAAAAFAPENAPEVQQTSREEARLSYLKAIEIDPKHVPAYLALARLQQAGNDAAGAMATYQQALQVTGSDGAVWYELGMCQARQKRWADTVGSLEKACEVSPANQNYRATLGYALARAGRLGDSLNTLTGVIGEARAYYDLARMLQHMGQPDVARKYLEAALTRDPNLKGAREMLARLSGTQEESHPVGYSPDGPASLPKLRPVTGRPAAPARPAEQAPIVVETTQPESVEAVPTLRIPPRPVINIRAGQK